MSRRSYQALQWELCSLMPTAARIHTHMNADLNMLPMQASVFGVPRKFHLKRVQSRLNLNQDWHSFPRATFYKVVQKSNGSYIRGLTVKGKGCCSPWLSGDFILPDSSLAVQHGKTWPEWSMWAFTRSSVPPQGDEWHSSLLSLALTVTQRKFTASSPF